MGAAGGRQPSGTRGPVLGLAWIIGALVLGLVEILTVDLFFLTLALAALITGLTAFAGVPLWGQIAVFVVVSALLLWLARPWAKNLLERSTPQVATNAQALIGKTAVVTHAFGPGTGRVRLMGEDWSARGQHGERFPVGTTVRVVEIAGATAVVGPVSEHVPTPPDSVPPEAD